MNILKIKELAENRVGGLRKLARDIGMSEANLHRCINNNRIQAQDLEKVALIFGVPIGVFFDEGNSPPVVSHTSASRKNTARADVKTGDVSSDSVSDLLKEKDKQIERLLGIIEKLTVKIDHVKIN